MKNLIWLFLVALILSSCSPVFLEQDEPPTFRSIYEIESWVRKNIDYKWDFENATLDSWQSPQTTMRLKTGDCEDLAILWMYFMQRDFSIDTELVLGVHKNVTYNHYWAHSIDNVYIFYDREDSYLFTKTYSYEDTMKMVH
jgi:hypothetical protein